MKLRKKLKIYLNHYGIIMDFQKIIHQNNIINYCINL